MAERPTNPTFDLFRSSVFSSRRIPPNSEACTGRKALGPSTVCVVAERGTHWKASNKRLAELAMSLSTQPFSCIAAYSARRRSTRYFSTNMEFWAIVKSSIPRNVEEVFKEAKLWVGRCERVGMRCSGNVLFWTSSCLITGGKSFIHSQQKFPRQIVTCELGFLG